MHVCTYACMHVCMYVCVRMFWCLRGAVLHCVRACVRAARSQCAPPFLRTRGFRVHDHSPFRNGSDHALSLPVFFRLHRSSMRGSRGCSSHLSCFYVLTALWASVRLGTPQSRHQNSPCGVLQDSDRVSLSRCFQALVRSCGMIFTTSTICSSI